MLSLTEMRDKTYKTTGKQITEMLDKGHFDYNETNLWGTGYNQTPEDRLKPSVVKEIWDTIKVAPLREFLGHTGPTASGSAYLIPTKIYQIMYDSAVEADIVADISIAMIPAEQIGGNQMNVDIAIDESYLPKKYSSGGAMPTETIATAQATLDFSTPFGINFKITNDLIEDAAFDVIEMHLRNAGREMGEFASNEALTVMIASTDGDGTVNSGTTTDANETRFTGATGVDIVDAMVDNLVDGFVSDTIVLTHSAALHNVFNTTGLVGNDSPVWGAFITGGWPTRMAGMNIVYSDCSVLTNAKVGDNLVTLIFDKDYALLSARKRWLRIENYSDPIRDMVGATITARQDSVSIYNDSVYYLLES